MRGNRARMCALAWLLVSLAMVGCMPVYRWHFQNASGETIRIATSKSVTEIPAGHTVTISDLWLPEAFVLSRSEGKAIYHIGWVHGPYAHQGFMSVYVWLRWGPGDSLVVASPPTHRPARHEIPSPIPIHPGVYYRWEEKLAAPIEVDTS